MIDFIVFLLWQIWIRMEIFNDTTTTNISDLYRCKIEENFKYILLPVSTLWCLCSVWRWTSRPCTSSCSEPNTGSPAPSTWSTSTSATRFTSSPCRSSSTITLIRTTGRSVSWCVSWFAFSSTQTYGSILFLSCISLHRFLGVCHPVRSLSWMNGRRARVVSVGIWVIILTLQAPILYFSRMNNNGDMKAQSTVCYDTTSKDLFNDFLVYSSVVMFLLFVIPFVVLVCNGLMVKKLQEPGIGGGPKSQLFKQKSVKMIIIVLLTFMLCFLPFHVNRSIYYTFRYLDKHVSCSMLEAASMAYKVTRPLASANSCLDPILYFMAGQGFRNSIKNKKSKSRSENRKSPSTSL